jgi:RNA polymerase sigma-70 factor (ECF subfamily)
MGNDGWLVSVVPGASVELVEIYDRALDEVYGYLLHRCGHIQTAQDLTSESFVAAARAVSTDAVAEVTVAWLIGIARHKLVDHWRRLEREEGTLRASDAPEPEDPWTARLDELHAVDVLRSLAPRHRTVLTLRYVDDLPVREVADAIGRSEHATEALLVRARVAFRRAYDRGGDG